MIIQKTKLHNELREMRVSKCDGFSPFYTIFRQFTVNTVFVKHIVRCQWWCWFLLLLLLLLLLRCRRIIFLCRPVLALPAFSSICQWFFFLLVRCSSSFSVCLILNFRFIRTYSFHSMLPIHGMSEQKNKRILIVLTCTLVAYLEMSITPLITIDLVSLIRVKMRKWIPNQG